MLNKIKYFVLYIIPAAILISGCDISEDKSTNGTITIGDRVISENELKKEISRVTFDMGLTDQEAGQGIRQIIEKIVEKNLILEYGKEQGITVTDEEMESVVRDIKRDFPDYVFNELLLKRYIDIDEWKSELEQELLLKKIVSSVVTRVDPPNYNELRDYFDSHQDDFWRPRMAQVRQIVTLSGEEADMIITRISEGEKMADLASVYSIAPEAEDNGIIGWIGEGDLEESMDEVIFSLNEGEISDILETSYGFHVFEIISTREEGITRFPEAMPEIDSILAMIKREELYKNWVDELKHRFPVKIDEEVFDKWSVEERQ